ncbi:hypothetical protein M5689_007601 [Euphorbia peplus]|nr:hypothetical protein M5689_007601 [Euphorbia peplus]
MPSDIGEILKLKISARLPPDDLYWGLTRSGTYSVKSGYFLTECVRFAGNSSPSFSAAAPSFFKNIWKVSLPPKIIHFAWQLLRIFYRLPRSSPAEELMCIAAAPSAKLASKHCCTCFFNVRVLFLCGKLLDSRNIFAKPRCIPSLIG